ncbi:class I SAM-dependent methyltransferase, partial [Nocardioides ultimimeridianus]
ADPGAEIEARRAAYPEVEGGVDRLLEERREDCPICGGTSLERHTEVPDLLQGKPGRFAVDRCRRCHTLFQNPRLTLGGLDFYYRDFYDGLSGEWMAEVFSGSRESYQGRVDLIGAHTTPQRLLDVGTGQGHFCLVARETWPETVLDGLDFTPNVDLAERRGRIDHAFNGLFPELAPKLEDTYDVVTMHHYLEHTRDPAAELAAAALVVTPGGYLEIEVPNPDTWLGRRLGGHWLPLLQPQHQQLIPLGRLRTMLREHGFSPVAAQLAEAHQPVDLGGAAYLLLNRWAPAGDVPWADPPGRLRRMARPVVVAALFPMVLAGFLLDRLLAPVLAHGGAASAYRVIARRDDVDGGGDA